MRVALIDNGSLEPAAHRTLRAVAAAVAERAGVPVTAVSWQHSDRIAADLLDGRPAWTVRPWIAAGLDRGEREYVFVPFFISAQGAIGSALRRDLEALAERAGGFAFSFTPGLGDLALAAILADRVRETMAAHALDRPPVIVVDHGGPSPASAALRDRVAAQLRADLGATVDSVAAASMESPDGPAFAFNQPLLADQLAALAPAHEALVIAPLFLSPGRHAGPNGDLARIAASQLTGGGRARAHFTGLVGTHPLAGEILAHALTAVASR